MSKATKRKYVTQEFQQDYTLPTGSQSIVRLTDTRGRNLHAVVDSLGQQYLVSMPVKFRHNIWVKTGHYVVVEPIAEGDKVKAEIVKILTKDHIKFYRSQQCWPKEFDAEEEAKKVVQPKPKREGSSEDDSDSDLFVNTNRRPLHLFESVETSSSDSSDSE